MNYNKALQAVFFCFTNWRAVRPALKYAIEEVMENPLCKLANEYGSDKGLGGHNYTRVYQRYILSRKERIRLLVEIGLSRDAYNRRNSQNNFTDAPSLRMWADLLPDARIIGFDIKSFSGFSYERCITISGDQAERGDLSKIWTCTGETPIDVVIDDGLHASRHQQISLGSLFPHLGPGGLYFIEDLTWQPPDVERPGDVKTLDVLNSWIRSGRFESPYLCDMENDILGREIETINLYDTMFGSPYGGLSLAVIKKRNNKFG